MKFSIMGDSISTFEDYNPFLHDVFYKGEIIEDWNGVEDTWWMQVIKHFGGELAVNNSWSGSFVAGLTEASGNSEARVAKLAEEDNVPDLVLVCMGANDCGGKIKLRGDTPSDELAFDTAYTIMLERIKTLLPNAKIFCATIMLTDEETGPNYNRRREYIESYNNIIRLVAAEQGCLLLETYNEHVGYTTVDGLHPDRAGQRLLGEIIIKELEKHLN